MLHFSVFLGAHLGDVVAVYFGISAPQAQLRIVMAYLETGYSYSYSYSYRYVAPGRYIYL